MKSLKYRPMQNVKPLKIAINFINVRMKTYGLITFKSIKYVKYIILISRFCHRLLFRYQRYTECITKSPESSSRCIVTASCMKRKLTRIPSLSELTEFYRKEPMTTRQWSDLPQVMSSTSK